MRMPTILTENPKLDRCVVCVLSLCLQRGWIKDDSTSHVRFSGLVKIQNMLN